MARLPIVSRTVAPRTAAVLVMLAMGAATLACGPRRLAHPGVPTGCGAFSVEGDRVLCAGRPFAEVERFAAGPGGCAGIRGYRGLAVRYASGERAWLFRAASMDPDRPGRYPGPKGEGEFKLGWVGDVELSPDGRRLSFRKPAIFSPARYEYDIPSGTLREVEWTEPRTRAAARAPCSAEASQGLTDAPPSRGD